MNKCSICYTEEVIGFIKYNIDNPFPAECTEYRCIEHLKENGVL